jgi:hypothetical protein
MSRFATSSDDMRPLWQQRMSRFAMNSLNRALKSEALIALGDERSKTFCSALVEATCTESKDTRDIVEEAIHHIFGWMDGRDKKNRSLACKTLVQALKNAKSQWHGPDSSSCTDSYAEAACLLFNNEDCLSDFTRSKVCVALVEDLKLSRQTDHLHAVLCIIHSFFSHEVGRIAFIGMRRLHFSFFNFL